jgi:DNA-binding IclR family transcriptional regulator
MIAQTGTQSIDRAGQLLVLVVSSDEPVTVGALAVTTGLPKSTASRLVGALERSGLVAREGARGGIRPGPVLQQFARRSVGTRDLAEVAAPHLQRLSDATGETINLTVPAPAGIEHLSQIDARHVIGAGSWVGRSAPHHASASGKVFLAHGAAELSSAALQQRTPATITDRALLDAALRTVRALGYATSIDELETGLVAIAAPVHDSAHRVVAAIAVSGPTQRMTPERVETIARLCAAEARALSAKIGQPTATETEGAA